MKIIHYDEPYTAESANCLSYYNEFYKEESLLFFDIETTGFVSKNTTLYLIGVLSFDAAGFHITQWFNDDGKSDALLITAFMDYCKDYTGLIHFNGLGFDLPYLKQKAAEYDINFDLNDTLKQIDIYKEIRPYKSIFSLENMKQVSIEQYLGLQREDKYTGKDLIHIYQRYVARPDKELEAILLLHNHDDVLGMPSVSKILNYKAFFDYMRPENIEITQTEHRIILHFTYQEFACLPKRIALTSNGMYLNAFETKAQLQIPILQDTLKHYFTDYKNYYYLPNEDMAIHKSVAAFVEPENRKKANKTNCYIKKQDKFLLTSSSLGKELFKTEALSKQYYQTLESFLKEDSSYYTIYIREMLKAF